MSSKRSMKSDFSLVDTKESSQFDEEVPRTYEPIESLQNFGVNASDLAKLKDSGFATVGQIFQSSQKQLLAVKGISEAKLDKISQAAHKAVPGKSGFVTASNLIERCKDRIFLTTGSEQLNQLLGGGLESMSVTEIHGEFRTGKTQLCHTLCVTTQLSRAEGGGAGKVAFVDTEGSFRPKRVAEIAKTRYNLDPDSVLDNILVARAYNHDTQMELVTKLGSILADPAQGPFRLLIVDSITALFRTDFQGRGELSERQQKLNEHLVRLVKHAEEFNIAVLLVNQVMADPGAVSMFGPVIRPIGGHVLSHAVHTRILMKKGREDNRICRLVDSPCMPEGEAMIRLASGGVCDVDD